MRKVLINGRDKNGESIVKRVNLKLCYKCRVYPKKERDSWDSGYKRVCPVCGIESIHSLSSRGANTSWNCLMRVKKGK